MAIQKELTTCMHILEVLSALAEEFFEKVRSVSLISVRTISYVWHQVDGPNGIRQPESRKT